VCLKIEQLFLIYTILAKIKLKIELVIFKEVKSDQFKSVAYDNSMQGITNGFIIITSVV